MSTPDTEIPVVSRQTIKPFKFGLDGVYVCNEVGCGARGQIHRTMPAKRKCMNCLTNVKFLCAICHRLIHCTNRARHTRTHKHITLKYHAMLEPEVTFVQGDYITDYASFEDIWQSKSRRIIRTIKHKIRIDAMQSPEESIEYNAGDHLEELFDLH